MTVEWYFSIRVFFVAIYIDIHSMWLIKHRENRKSFYRFFFRIRIFRNSQNIACVFIIRFVTADRAGSCFVYVILSGLSRPPFDKDLLRLSILFNFLSIQVTVVAVSAVTSRTPPQQSELGAVSELTDL